MSRLSEEVSAMLQTYKRVMTAFVEACPRMTELNLLENPVDDRREMFWRLADDDQSLVCGQKKENVEEIGDDTFVDTAYCVWRPTDENFVVVLANTEIGDPSVVAFLSANMEIKERKEG